MKVYLRAYALPFLVFVALLVILMRGALNLKPKSDQIHKIASLNLASDEILVDILTKAKALHKLIAISTLADQKEYS